MPVAYNVLTLIDGLMFFGFGTALALLIGLDPAYLGRKLGVMDSPGGRKSHTTPTPAVGGIIAMTAGVTLWVASFSWNAQTPSAPSIERVVLVLCFLAVALMGFMDDRRHLSAQTRLFADLIIFGVALALLPSLKIEVISFPSFGLSLELGAWGYALSWLSLVILKHAINLADGRNGLVLGLAIIWSVFFLWHTPLSLLPIIAGSCGIFVVLFYKNVRGQLFLGDCGSYAVATAFGFFALRIHNEDAVSISSAECILLFVIPVADMVRIFFVRIIRKQSPFQPDQNHFHHILEARLGWSRGWLIYMLSVATPLALYQFFSGYGCQIILGTLFYFNVAIIMLQRRSDQMLSQSSQQIPDQG